MCMCQGEISFKQKDALSQSYTVHFTVTKLNRINKRKGVHCYAYL